MRFCSIFSKRKKKRMKTNKAKYNESFPLNKSIQINYLFSPFICHIYHNDKVIPKMYN